VQRPHPPITVGGRGPKRTLRTAARWAQQWNVITSGVEDWVALKEVLAGHCADLGRDLKEITCSVNVRLDEEKDRATSIAEAVEVAAGYRDAGVDLAVMNIPIGAKPDILEPLAQALAPLAG
jgi:alkanesulfonate monooxygenase SsuD/methylene tetrahydromethanopterin reductase-like flavin-dependent oxidoreductase (luciferase family)